MEGGLLKGFGASQSQLQDTVLLVFQRRSTAHARQSRGCRGGSR